MDHEKEESYIQLLNANSVGLHLIPEEDRLFRLCEYAVGLYPLALEAVPMKYRIPSLCYNTVRANGTAIKYVPLHLYSDELFLIGAISTPEVSRYIEFTININVLLAIASHHNSLWRLKDYQKVESVCLRGVTCGSPLHDVPVFSRTKAICIEAIKVNPAQYYDVPEIIVCEELLIELVRHHPQYIRELDVNLITEKIALAALNADYTVFKYIPIQTQNICELAIDRDYKALACIVDQTEDLCKRAALIHAEAVSLIRDNYMKQLMSDYIIDSLTDIMG